MVNREVLDGGDVRLTADGCTFHFRRPRAGVLHVTVEGRDRGQFGPAALDEIRAEIGRHPPVALFVDARAVEGVAMKVSEEWTQFFNQNRAQLRQVNILVKSKVLHLTMSIAQHFSRTGGLIKIHSDAPSFEAALTATAS
jgi:hypothetical protein